MLPPAADRPKLRATLDQLASAVEDLLLGGLTTASEATRQTLAGATQEAARMRLLRLGAVLRVLADDLNRFNTQDPLLSRRRLTMFLNRGWLIARGLSHALETGDEKEYDRLNFTPATQPLARADLVCLGVVKKMTAAVARFEFRFRTLSASGAVKAGDALVWTCMQAVKNPSFPPEAYLHLSQKQKFTPYSLLERKVQTVQNAVVVPDDAGGWRLSLTDTSTVTPGAAFADWAQFLNWTPAPAMERLGRQSPGPLDLDTELQEEVVLSSHRGPPVVSRPGRGGGGGEVVEEGSGRPAEAEKGPPAAVRPDALRALPAGAPAAVHVRPERAGVPHHLGGEGGQGGAVARTVLIRSVTPPTFAPEPPLTWPRNPRPKPSRPPRPRRAPTPSCASLPRRATPTSWRRCGRTTPTRRRPTGSCPRAAS
jgi:hypothetical protein